MVEQPHSSAWQHGSQIDVDLVEQPGVQALLDRLGAVHRFRSSNGALDAVGDELDCRAGSWPALGQVVGDDEGGHIPRVLASSAIGDLEGAPHGEHRADLSLQTAQVVGARPRYVERHARCRAGCGAHREPNDVLADIRRAQAEVFSVEGVAEAAIAPYEALIELIERAQQSGDIDPDRKPDEIVFMIHSVCQGLAGSELAAKPPPMGAGMWLRLGDYDRSEAWTISCTQSLTVSRQQTSGQASQKPLRVVVSREAACVGGISARAIR